MEELNDFNINKNEIKPGISLPFISQSCLLEISNYCPPITKDKKTKTKERKEIFNVVEQRKSIQLLYRKLGIKYQLKLNLWLLRVYYKTVCWSMDILFIQKCPYTNVLCWNTVVLDVQKWCLLWNTVYCKYTFRCRHATKFD